jgi:hypothetical protein
MMFKTSYLCYEVNCTEPSPSVSIPWLDQSTLVYSAQNVKKATLVRRSTVLCLSL